MVPAARHPSAASRRINYGGPPRPEPCTRGVPKAAVAPEAVGAGAVAPRPGREVKPKCAAGRGGPGPLAAASVSAGALPTAPMSHRAPQGPEEEQQGREQQQEEARGSQERSKSRQQAPARTGKSQERQERKRKRLEAQELQKIQHLESFYEKPPPGLIKENETKPEDCIPDMPGNEGAREFLAHAPTKGLWMPLGKEVKVMQCWRCKRYGHRTGDKECPFFIKGNQKLEQYRVAHEDPMYNIIKENKRQEREKRIQQLKQLLEDSTSEDNSDKDDEDSSSSTSSEGRDKHKKKKRKKEKKKKEKKKKKKRKRKSSRSNEKSESD